MKAKARDMLGSRGTVETAACAPSTKCEIALMLDAAATEAPRGSIHNFATGIRPEGSLLR
jgi:hypothetical protein